MDSISFLRKVLPDEGVRFVCRGFFVEGNPRMLFQHDTAGSFEELMMKANRWAARSDKVYYACAAYKEATYKPFTKPDGTVKQIVSRGSDNGKVLSARSMWEDIDVGKPNPDKCYPTQKEAATELFKACKTIGIPWPMLVSSGKGLHCYWPLTENVSYEQWIVLAELKKAAFVHAGLKIDPSRAADIKSILRPVGIQGSGGNTVKVIRDAGPFTYQSLFDALQAYTAKNNAPVHSRTQREPVANELGEVSYPPSYAASIAERCNQIKLARDTKGAVSISYDWWWHVIGVLQATVEGEAVCHAWSEAYPKYTYEETQAKLESWSSPPTRCETFALSNPEGCKACQYNGKITTPMSLGYAADEAPVNNIPMAVVEDTEPSTVTAVTTLPKTLADIEWPSGYGINSFGLPTKAVVDGDGVVEHKPFASRPFFIHEHILNTDFTRTYRIAYQAKNGRWREFNLDAELMADQRNFAKGFAAHEIFFYGKFGVEAAMQLVSSFVQKNKSVETRQVKHMGWMYNEAGALEDAFVIGKHVITKDSVHPVRCDGGLEGAISALARQGGQFNVAGTSKSWLDMVNHIYGRKGAEPHMLVILAGFAAPLVEFTRSGEWHGIPIALTGGTSAGKTKACEVQSSIYASSKALVVGGGRGGSSFMAATKIPGYICNLPLTFDEMSERPPEEVRDLLYQLPQGAEKIVLNADRTIRKAELYWNTIPNLTSNEDMYGLSAKFTGNVKSALQVRVFEVRMPDNYTSTIWPDINPKADIDPVLEANYGIVGREWIQFVIKHREQIKQKVLKAQVKYTPSNSGMDSAERFYADLAATVLVTAKLLTKVLGWLDLDVNAFEKWMRNVIEDNRNRRVESGFTTKDKVSSLLRFHHDAILFTKHFPVFARGANFAMEIGYERPRRGTSIRLSYEDKRLFVAMEAIDEWCGKLNVNKHQFIQDMLTEGFLKLTVDLARRKNAASACRVNIGKGTEEPTGQVRCLELDYSMVFEDDLALEKVVHIESALRESAQSC